MDSRFPRYERLLRLYPKPYRNKYAKQMTQTLSDMLDDQPNNLGKTLVWFRVGRDLPVSIVRQNTLALGGNLMHTTPGYIKRNGFIAGILLVPFFAALVANGFDEAVRGQTLYTSWLWSTPVLTTWILILPLLAVLLAITSYAVYAIKAKQIGLKQTWPILLTGLVGVGIVLLLLFHDSAHCLLQNPTHIHQIWQCTTRGFLGGH